MLTRGLLVPEGYSSPLSLMQTEIAIKLVKDTFERELAGALSLTRVSAPLFVLPESGLNDDLNGVERPVQFDVLDMGRDVQVVHSLAKWKRMALYRYAVPRGEGIYTDMNAIRRDETLDNIHSVYVDQWDWELVVSAEDRNLDFLQGIVRKIYGAFTKTEQKLIAQFPQIEPILCDNIYFITTQELEDKFPNLTAKEREDAICREHKAVFLMQIGGKLSSGSSHDGRAPDYDDWTLNGDLLVWNPILGSAFEISSMGIRVDAKALASQLKAAGCEERSKLQYHKMLLEGKLPLTIGGGLGQSRICMLLLHKAHIGEVHASVWPQEMTELCEQNGIHLL